MQDTQEFLTNILSRPAWGGELIRKDSKKYCVWFFFFPFSVWGKTVNDIEKWQKCMKWLPVIQSPGENHNDWAGKYPFNHLSASAPIKICVYQLSWMNSCCYSTCVFHSSICHEHFQGCQWWETCFPFSKNVNYIPQRSFFPHQRICAFASLEAETLLLHHFPPIVTDHPFLVGCPATTTKTIHPSSPWLCVVMWLSSSQQGVRRRGICATFWMCPVAVSHVFTNSFTFISLRWSLIPTPPLDICYT